MTGRGITRPAQAPPLGAEGRGHPVRRRSFTLARRGGRRPLAILVIVRTVRPEIQKRIRQEDDFEAIRGGRAGNEISVDGSPTSRTTGSILCGQVWPPAIEKTGMTTPTLDPLACPCPIIAELSVLSEKGVEGCDHKAFNISSSLRLGSLGIFLILICQDGLEGLA